MQFHDDFLEDWGDTQTLESGYKCFTFPDISAGVTFIYETCLQPQPSSPVPEIYNFPPAAILHSIQAAILHSI